MEEAGLKSQSGGPGLGGEGQLNIVGDDMARSKWVEPMTLIPGIDVICPNVTTTNVRMRETESGFRLIWTPRTKD